MPEVIPVRGVDDVLVLEAGSLPSSLATTLRESTFRIVLLDGHRRGEAERHRLEIARRRLRLQLSKSWPGHLQHAPWPRRATIQPSMLARAHVLVRRHEIEALAKLALDDFERIAGGLVFVDDEDAGGAASAPPLRTCRSSGRSTSSPCR